MEISFLLVREMLESALKEVHGQVNYKTDFWDPETFMRLKDPAEYLQNLKPKPETVNEPDEDVPELISSRSVKEGTRTRREPGVLSAHTFQDHEIKIKESRASHGARDWNGNF